MRRDPRHRTENWPWERLLFWCAFAVFLAPVIYVQMSGGGYPVPDEKIRITRFLCACSLVAILAMCGLVFRGLRKRALRRQRAEQGFCVTCGYDLRAHAKGERCPECGTAAPGGA